MLLQEDSFLDFVKPTYQVPAFHEAQLNGLTIVFLNSILEAKRYEKP